MPGLRREELAALAGVSADYYTRLEQGRDVNVSAEVLDAVCRTLRLDNAERSHLHHLARPGQPAPARVRPQGPTHRVRPGLLRVLDTLDNAPAMVVGRRLEILAWNRLASALITDFAALPESGRNGIRLLFLDDSVKDLYPDWEQVARDAVADLRMDAGRHPDDPLLVALVGELSELSEDFRRWWAEHPVREKANGTKRFHHPIVGELTLSYETFRLPDDPDQALVINTAQPGSPSAEALSLLASWGTKARPARTAARA